MNPSFSRWYYINREVEIEKAFKAIALYEVHKGSSIKDIALALEEYHNALVYSYKEYCKNTGVKYIMDFNLENVFSVADSALKTL